MGFEIKRGGLVCVIYRAHKFWNVWCVKYNKVSDVSKYHEFECNALNSNLNCNLFGWMLPNLNCY